MKNKFCKIELSAKSETNFKILVSQNTKKRSIEEGTSGEIYFFFATKNVKKRSHEENGEGEEEGLTRFKLNMEQ